MSTRFSIIMPTFNHAPFIGETIATVLSQTFSDWELIIVDNHSTDGTTQIAQTFSQQDSRIRHVLFSNGGSIAKSRNYAMSMAKGEFCSFLDSDDLWHPEKLALVDRTIGSDNNVDFVFHDSVNFKSNYVFSPEKLPEFRTEILKKPFLKLVEQNFVTCLSVTLRTSFVSEVGNFDEDISITGHEDWDLWLRISKVRDLIHLPLKLGAYRVHPGGCSKRSGPMVIASNRVMAKHVLNNPELSEDVRDRALYGNLERCAYYLSFDKKSSEIIKLLLPGMRLNPKKWTYYFSRCLLRALTPSR